MDPNRYETIESFVRTFERVSDALKQKNPDCILAPMMGAVPFIDVLNIIDDSFPNYKVEYVPASNKVYQLKNVLKSAFGSLIAEYCPQGGSFVSIDEVVSGNSVQRIYKQFDSARRDYANAKTGETFGSTADFKSKNVRDYRDSIVKSIRYVSLGIVDSKLSKTPEKMTEEYKRLVDDGVVIPFDTDCIVTMDRTEFFPANYRSVTLKGRQLFLPVVKGFKVSEAYLDFLRAVAEIVGKNPADVTLSNMLKIKESHHWVSDEFKEL